MSERATNLKDEGNAFFKSGHYGAAVLRYSEAIVVVGESKDEGLPALHVLYCNRAFAQQRLENFGSAVADASKSVEILPEFGKGYYRRACALIALARFKEAVKDLQIAQRLSPGDADTSAKLKECKKQIQYMAFAAAIVSERTLKAVEVFGDIGARFPVPSNYDGPVYNGPSGLTAEWLIELTNWLKKEKLIHKQFAYRIVMDAYKLFLSEPTLVRVPLIGDEKDDSIDKSNAITVCGDIHGQFYDLLNIFEINGRPSETNPYLFNGDFVDRGSFSVECILTLFAYKLAYPKHLFLARGNHETKSMNRLYGFEGEVVAKYDEGLYNAFCDAFAVLPLAHLIGNAVFVVHGGLFSSDTVTLEDIEKIPRDCEPGEEGLPVELLWADPMPQRGRQPSKRGVGLSFGPDVTENFLKRNGLQLVIRSHEMKEEGYEVEHAGRLVTVFSAPNYCDQMGNKGAFVRVSLNDSGKVKTEYTKFDAVAHPDKRAMCYANKMLFT